MDEVGMTQRKVDVLIAGQGLAGSLCAFEMMQRGLTVMVVDPVPERSSSLAAAGLFNPVTGRKMVKTWQADVLFDRLMSYYPAMEKELGASFFHPKTIYRPFVEMAEQNDWQGRWSDSSFAGFIDAVMPPNAFQEHCVDPYGGVSLAKSGWVNLPELILAVREYLKGHDSWRQGELKEEEVIISEDGVVWQGIEARWLVHCTGTGAATPDTYWGWLPFRPVKGEVLLLDLEEPLPRIYNRGVFVLPVGDKQAKVGSTYHHDLSPGPTEKGKNEMLGKLEALLRVPFTVVGHWDGIRPATKDRRPMIGQHPEYAPLWIFNGLGAKGVSLGPWFVGQLADAMIDGKALWPEVDIERFATYY